MCVGIFSRSCLIKETYETVCYCESLDLPDEVKLHYVLQMVVLLAVIPIAGNTGSSFPVSVSWRIVHCSVVCSFVCSGVLCAVDLSC